MAADGSQHISELKLEHEDFRRRVRDVDKALGGIDELLAVAPAEKLKELRDRLLVVHDTFVALRESNATHTGKENKILVPRQSSKTARALRTQHDEIAQAIDQSIKATREALPENASREQLRESSLIVQNIFYGIIGMVTKHMSAEDSLIDMMAAAEMTKAQKPDAKSNPKG